MPRATMRSLIDTKDILERYKKCGYSSIEEARLEDIVNRVEQNIVEQAVYLVSLEEVAKRTGIFKKSRSERLDIRYSCKDIDKALKDIDTKLMKFEEYRKMKTIEENEKLDRWL